MMKFFYSLLVALLVAFTNAVPAAAALRGGDVDNAVVPDETIDAELAEKMKAQLELALKTVDYHRKLEERKNPRRKLWYTYMFDYVWTPGVWSGTADCNWCDPDDDYYAEVKCNLGINDARWCRD